MVIYKKMLKSDVISR